MATKITTGLIDSGAITSALITDASITADDLHTTLDLTGKTVTVATASAGDNDTSVASTAFVSTAIANLADSAPSTLDTLNELAAALGDDASFSTTVTNSIATKLPLAGGTITGTLNIDSNGGVDNYYLRFKESGADRFTMYENSNNVYLNGGPGNTIFRPRQNGGTGNFAVSGSNVGIGTIIPATELQIGDYTDNAETLTFATASDQTGRINFYNNNSTEGASIRVTGGGNGATMYFANRYNGDADKVTFDLVNGKVGIGTTNPGAHLHVDGVGPIIKLGSYSFITEDIEDNDSLGFWTHTTESILFGQTSNALTSQNVTCRIDNNGILRPTRFRLPASALPTSALAAGELHVDTGDSNKVKVYDGSAWISLNNAAVGESGNPAADGAALLAESASNGSYYFDHDGTEYQTYYIGDVLGGGWQLAMCVTNGATAGTGHTGTGVADWFNGDTTIGAGNTGVTATGTNWFTASNSSELNVTSMTALNKTNSRGRGFFKSFTNMMIRQNIGGTVGYRSYVLNASNSLYSWFQTADHTGFTNRTSSSSTAGSGVTTNNSTAIRLSNIDFNYQLSNDGGRIVTSGGVVTESSGGVACRVDGHRGYNWVGNVVNDYTARAYSNNGRLNDHTLWIFVK